MNRLVFVGYFCSEPGGGPRRVSGTAAEVIRHGHPPHVQIPGSGPPICPSDEHDYHQAKEEAGVVTPE